MKVTKDMIASGVAQLNYYDHRFELPEEAVERIFSAMMRCAKTGQRQTNLMPEETYEDFQREAIRRFPDGPFRKP